MPQAPEGVIDILQRSVSLHLTAIEQYQGQAKHFSRWGYEKLGKRYEEDVEEERGHLSKVVERLEFYDVSPDYTHAAPKWPRHDYTGVLQANLELESAAMEFEREAVQIARDAGDELTAKAFARLLAGSEASVAEIEAIERVLGDIGVDNYLANQV